MNRFILRKGDLILGKEISSEFLEEFDKGVRNVRVKSTDASLFEMVSEECSELSHVSSKLARYLRREQPVSGTFDPDSAISNFVEEFSDVILASLVAAAPFVNEEIIFKNVRRKLNRWQKRLEGKE